MKRIGFIGLGIMGRPMARNLLKAGYSLTVYDLDREAIDSLVTEGGVRASSPKEVAEKSDFVIIMVPDSPQVEQVIYGDKGVIAGSKKGDIIIDMSSVTPSTDQKLSKVASDKGVKVLDAPVSGGEAGAIEGILTIMVGGDQDVFNECIDVFASMGKSIVRVGEIGAGQTTKLVNQIIVALTLGALAEGFTLGAKAGVDPEKIFYAIKDGFAASKAMHEKIPKVLERNFKPGFKILHQLKDLNNALTTAKELGIALPLTSLIHQMYLSLKSGGKEDLDHSAIFNLNEDLTSIKICKQKY